MKVDGCPAVMFIADSADLNKAKWMPAVEIDIGRTDGFD